MHILIAILTAAAGAFWAFHYFVQGAHKGREALSDAKGLWRSGKWSKQVSQRLVENLTDPREAAAILLFQIAEYDGAVTDAQKKAILSKMTDTFGVDANTGEELYAFARMAVGQAGDAGNSLRKLLIPVNEACTDEEKRGLLEMLADVAAVEGEVSTRQQELMLNVKRRLFPQ